LIHHDHCSEKWSSVSVVTIQSKSGFCLSRSSELVFKKKAENFILSQHIQKKRVQSSMYDHICAKIFLCGLRKKKKNLGSKIELFGLFKTMIL
jgi:hypothetical protein